MGGFSEPGHGSVYGDGREDGRGWPDGRPGRGRDERLSGFAQDCPGGPLRPNAELAVMLDEVCGSERRCAGGTDSELLGIAGRWAAVEAWAFSARLGVVRELIRRRPRPGSERERAGRGDAPTPWERGLEHEVSVELRISLTAAGKLLYLAWALEDRLPRVGQALDAGRLDAARARMIVDETDLLDDPLQVARAEEMILAGLEDCKTWAATQRLAALAACTVDPGGAARRREVAEREHARIRLWRESSGAAGLGGYSLPPDETLAAMAHVEARAQWYRKAGIKERIDMLRVMAFLDLLSCVPADDRVTRWQAGQAAKAGANAGEKASAGAAEEDAPDAEAAGDEPVPGTDAPGACGCRDEVSRQCPCREATTGGQTDGGHDDQGEDNCGCDGRGHNERSGDDREVNGGNINDCGGSDRSGDDHCGDGCGGGGRCGRDRGGDDRCGGDRSGDDRCRGDRGGDCGGDDCSGGYRGGDDYGGDRGGGDGDVNDYSGDDYDIDGRGVDGRGDDLDGDWPDGSGGGRGRGSGGGRPRRGAKVPGGAVLPALPALPALVNLTLPLATQMRLAERPGEARGLGALDPGLVRRLAEAAARSPRSKFCVSIIDEQGHAIAHGCCKPARKARDTSAAGRIPAQGQSQGGQASSGQGGQANNNRRGGQARNSKAPSGPAPPAAFTRSGRPGPPGGYGSWVLTLPGAAAPFTVDLYPVPVGECDHRDESLRHDPGDRLRHLVQVRDGKCSFPTCSRYARETDFEHGVPYEKGGRTCGCNCHSPRVR